MKRMWSKNELKAVIQNQASSGDLQNVKVFEEIIDKDGHKRFVDFAATGISKEGITSTFDKCSLSGTHLLIVACFTAEVGAVLSNGDTILSCELPKWIYDKIVPVWANTYIDNQGQVLRDDSWNTQSFNAGLIKAANNKLNIINTSSALTISSSNKNCRIAFDLLIDNE